MEYQAINKNEIPDFDQSRDYFITNIVGDCMNAPGSPAKVGTGGRVLCHTIDKFDFLRDWEQYQGRAVVFQLAASHPLARGGACMIKEFCRIDWGLFVVLQYHNPRKTLLSIGTDEFNRIAIVDKVLAEN